MGYMIEYKDETNTYQIKHSNACEYCKHKKGNSLAVMKVIINDDGLTDYSIKFKEIISLNQMRQLTTYLDQYIEEVIEGSAF
tara:strand:+ start:373 stop:618 length:246 start_codon:yes stop_codon:yes gene_type:complete